ncbi:MAG: TlpA family protein disulfide reductase [Hyphomicrobium sp.]
MSNDANRAAPRLPLAMTLGIAALSAAIGFAAVYVTLGRNDNAGTPAASTSNKPAGTGLAGFVRKAAPEALTDVAFLDPDGKELKLSAFKGRTVLLNLWATWCAPCRKEMPSLDRLQKELGSDTFEVVALAVDRTGLEGAGKFLDEIKVGSLKLYADPTARSGAGLKAVGMPTTILIDREGREIGRLAGPAEWDSAEAKALIVEALR